MWGDALGAEPPGPSRARSVGGAVMEGESESAGAAAGATAAGEGGGWALAVEAPGAQTALAREGARVHTTVGGRYVTLVRLRGRLHAFDSNCYHAGGPLGLGDIEETGGRLCVVCPWHHYQITLDTGEKLYQSLERAPDTGQMRPGPWKSIGPRQRVHGVEERPDGGVYVRLRDAQSDPGADPKLAACDAYAFDAACGRRLAQDGAAAAGRAQRQLARPTAVEESRETAPRAETGAANSLSSLILCPVVRDVSVHAHTGRECGSVGL